MRFTLAIISLPVLFLCFLGLGANWPVDCGSGGCEGGADSLGGSKPLTVLFGFAIFLCLAGVGAIGFKRTMLGVALVVGSVVLVVVGL